MLNPNSAHALQARHKTWGRSPLLPSALCLPLPLVIILKLPESCLGVQLTQCSRTHHAMRLSRHAIPIATSGLRAFITAQTLQSKRPVVTNWRINNVVWLKCLFPVDTDDILIIMSLWRIYFAIQMMWKTLIFLLMMNVSLVAVSTFRVCFYWSGCVWLKKRR